MNSWYYFTIVGCFCVVIIKSNPPSCTTPNGEKAFCKSVFSCPILQEAITSKDPLVKKFVEASGCSEGQFMVCCGTSGNYTDAPLVENRNKEEKIVTKESHRDFVINKLLPSKTYCGLQHTDDYVYTGSATSVDEFPWMLYIPLVAHGRQSDPDWELKCAGVLISNQYALTYTNCATQHLSSVKIGQYHKYQNISCIKTSFGVDDCTEPTIVVEVTEKLQFGDNLLLRLANKIHYSDFIRPICLPLEESDRPQIGDTIVTSGWGEESFGGKTLKIKKRVKHMLTSDEDCRKSYESETTPILCAATLPNTTSYACDGDEGGPMMYQKNNNWFVEGIIGFLPGCSSNQPVAGERITPEAVEWIIETMHA